ncbi:hypothetical protein ACH5RR_000036 [Cinchona calisaya]|uniref:Protein TILLER ANGLE CONTROL 1 n=1 Tax=Cinchona calisaya TaxID=153742 RepID=A0ABD3AZK2_9GENT
MKIFNWMHRRLIPKDGLGQNVKKEEEILVNDVETEALLEDVVPADMLQFHGWRGAAILSIGTFGLKDNINFSINHEYNKEYFELIGKYEGMEESDEEDDEYSDVHHVEEYSNNSDVDGEEFYEEEEWNPLVYDKSGAPRTDDMIMMNLQDYSSSYMSDDDNLIKNNMMKKKKERITLADLFSADSDDDDHIHGTSTKNPNQRPSQCTKKPITPTPLSTPAAKNGTLFAKKLIPRFKEDSRPIQKLHGLMKRMLKRKIHPDVVEGKNIKPCAAGNENPQFGIGESVSLLQSQDATSEL